MTPAQRRALEILEAHPDGIRGREFARAFFPADSPGWRHPTKSGPKGTHRGGIMYLAGGAYLGKLGRKGWTRYLGWDKGHALSATGAKTLADARARDAAKADRVAALAAQRAAAL
jgi:hypothetical protein